MPRIYKRKNIWYIDIRVKGRRIRKKVGHSKRVAELALKNAEVKIAREEFGFTNKDITIEKLIELFLDYNRVNNRISTTRRYKAVTDHLRNYLKEKRPNVIMLSQLKEDIIEGYKSYRRNAWVNPNGSHVKSDDIKEYTRQGARARTINLEVDGVKAMLNMAIRWGYLKDNPLKLVKPLKEDDRKPLRFLTIEECNKLLEAAPPDLFPVYFTFLNTGMRKAELENLLWSDVNFKRRKILIRGKDDWKPKTGEREIPINDSLYSVLEDLKARSKTTSNDDYVFKARKSGYSHNSLRRELIKLGVKISIEGLSKLHTLRHTFASHLVMSGVDLPTVQKLMGHSDIQTTMIYAHLAPDHLAKAVTKLPFKKR